jgi:hypothetical protein
MTLKEVKEQLQKQEQVIFKLEDGTTIPAHFHVTEVGEVNKRFIDCGGTLREERVANFQLWTAEDVDHRLSAEKLRSIIQLSETKLFISENLPVEVEYQSSTIGKYQLGFDGEAFVLQSTLTDCLAKDKCGIPTEKLPRTSKPKIKLSDWQQMKCEPNSGCC